MRLLDAILDRIGLFVARVIQKETSGYQPFTPSDPETLKRCLQPGDVLLVEGNQKLSAAIKYLTQSTWSHAALYVGDACAAPQADGERPCLVEAILGAGVIAVPLSKYRTYNTRICRAHALSQADRNRVVAFMVDSLGLQYDMRHILDMLRYFFPFPPVPVRWRRRMIAFGSGDPTRAICSSLIAQAFQSVPYPILPEVTRAPGRAAAASTYSRSEILHIRNHTLFTPRDFDLSPYFAVVKPTLESDFDYRKIVWGSGADANSAASG